MAAEQKLQASRFEIKYLIDERRALAIRDFLRPYVVPDSHSHPDRPLGYHVHSLYLDSPGLALFHQGAQGLKNRVKLRIRWYRDSSASPAFLEVKRRVSDVILKERAVVTRAGVRQLLAERWLDQRHLLKSDEGGARLEFCRLMNGFAAEGCAYVSYLREAYVSPGSDQLRVTFDRQLRGGRFDPAVCLALPAQCVSPPVSGVVLEVKFTDRFPRWLHDLVVAFNLYRTSMAKYVACVEALGLADGKQSLPSERLAHA